MSENKKVIPVTTPYKIIGTIITIALFVYITFAIYDWLVNVLIGMAGDAYVSGEYDNTYIYVMMAFFASSYQLVILGGGIFMGIIVAWVAVEEIGLEKNEKPSAKKPVSDMIWGFFYPIGAAIVMLPLYIVLSFIVSFGHTQQLIAAMESVSFSDTISLHVTTTGSFLLLIYIIYLVGLMPANAVSIFIVSIMATPYLKRRYRMRVEIEPRVEDQSLHEEASKITPTTTQHEEDQPLHELLNPEPDDES